jgi:gas vesicle protein
LEITRFCRLKNTAAWWHYNFFSDEEKTIKMNTTSKIITGFLIGAVIGTVAGLLVAPVTGKKTRKNIQKKTKKIAKQVAGYMGGSDKSQKPARHTKNGKAAVEV